MKTTERELYSAIQLGGSYTSNSGLKRTNSEKKATLRSSRIRRTITSIRQSLIFHKDTENLHAPAIDIDRIHCELKQSSTEGNYHLYIDKPMSWSDYAKLLTVLFEIGVIEEGFYRRSLEDEQSFLRIRHKDHDPKPIPYEPF
jgi:hypothetical protein